MLRRCAWVSNVFQIRSTPNLGGDVFGVGLHADFIKGKRRSFTATSNSTICSKSVYPGGEPRTSFAQEDEVLMVVFNFPASRKTVEVVMEFVECIQERFKILVVR